MKRNCTSKECQLADERIRKETERQRKEKLDKENKPSYNKENKQRN